MTLDLRLLSSIRLEAGRCSLLSFHLDRFATGAKALNVALDLAGLEQALTGVAAGYTQLNPAKLRVTVARDGLWTIEEPEPIVADKSKPIAMLWSDPVRSDDPLLPYCTTPRPVYDEALRRAKEIGYIDALFRNEQGLVTEGADHSIFVRHGGCWRTPTLGAGVLPGVYRRYLLETMADAREEDFGAERLFDADEIWLTNALYGARTVTIAAGE